MVLAAELARLDRRLEAARTEHNRLVDLYQAGLIDMPELKRRAAAITARQRDTGQKRASLAAERADLARGNRLRHGVEHFAARVRAVIDQLDPTQRQELMRLLIEDVQLTGWHVKSGCASRSTTRHTVITPTAGHPNPGRHQPAAARRHCQLKTVCVPFMFMNGPSYVAGG